MKFLNHVLICLFALSLLSQSHPISVYGSWGSQKYKSQIRETYIDQEIEIIPQENKICMGFGTFSLGDFHYVKTLDKLFFREDSIKVKIKKIDFEDETITAKLFHPEYGFGSITFFFDEKQYKSTDAIKFKEVLESSLSRAMLNKVVINSETGKYHLPSCNHLPQADNSEIIDREQAVQGGFTPCGFCFKHFIYLPDYLLEQSMARKMSASLRYYSPISENSAEQLTLSKTGKKVLSSWPVELLGYDYRFTLVNSSSVNAFALPGGHVFVTTSLYRSLEDPLELEAVLSHEIAHVERRHTLKSFRKQQRVRQTQAFMAAMGGTMAGMAASRGNYGTANSALAISVTMMALTELTNRGYSKEHEREADLFANLYFDQNGLDKKWLSSMFKKLQFVSLCELADPDPDSRTHPQLRERIDTIDSTKFKTLDGNILFCSDKRLRQLYIEPLFMSSVGSKTTLFIFIDNNNFVSKKMHSFEAEGTYLTIKSGTKSVRFKYIKNSTVFTEFGAILTFKYNNKKNLELTEFTDIGIEIEETERGISALGKRFKFSSL